MKRLKSVYHFLGGVRFAIILIALTLLYVIAGTFLESFADSHLYAAQYAYNNPFFYLLLAGFFINILLSALRRWPFKPKHVPFLITHLGLLMIITGTFIKNWKGLQGHMTILEGGITDDVFFPNTQSIQIEARDGTKRKWTPEDPLGIKIVDQSPNAREQLKLWFKGDFVTLIGQQPIPVSDEFSTITIFGKPWKIVAVRNPDPQKVAEGFFINGTELQIKETGTKRILKTVPLHDAINRAVEVPGFGQMRARLDNLQLHVNYLQNFGAGELTIPLQGDQSLSNISSTPELGKDPITIDLKRDPTIVFVQDDFGDEHLFLFDQFGAIQQEQFAPHQLQSLYMLEGGFAGYTLASQSKIPSLSNSREDKELLHQKKLVTKIAESYKQNEGLAFPIDQFAAACKKTNSDFATHFVSFLNDWNEEGGWFYPKNKPLPNELQTIFDTIDLKGNNRYCQTASLLFSKLEPELKQGKHPYAILSALQWPLAKELEGLSQSETLYQLQKQLETISGQLPEIPFDDPLQNRSLNAHLFSIYLRGMGIHLHHFEEEIDLPPHETVQLETFVEKEILDLEPIKKLEENLPKVTLIVSDDKKSEKISLVYDRSGNGLKWPVLDGNYLLRLQPEHKKIPYLVRLRDARQTNYHNSSQAHSYEADVIVIDKRTGKEVETTLSMNKVHETWDGYRFYLSNISPEGETSAQRVQLVVNGDPAKYVLTYFGAILVCVGIVALWMKMRRDEMR